MKNTVLYLQMIQFFVIIANRNKMIQVFIHFKSFMAKTCKFIISNMFTYYILSFLKYLFKVNLRFYRAEHHSCLKKQFTPRVGYVFIVFNIVISCLGSVC